MSDKSEVWRPRRQHRRHIYYKVQVFDSVSLTWRDKKEAFDEKDAARAYLEGLDEEQARVMVVDGRNRYPLEC